MFAPAVSHRLLPGAAQIRCGAGGSGQQAGSSKQRSSNSNNVPTKRPRMWHHHRRLEPAPPGTAASPRGAGDTPHRPEGARAELYPELGPQVKVVGPVHQLPQPEPQAGPSMPPGSPSTCQQPRDPVRGRLPPRPRLMARRRWHRRRHRACRQTQAAELAATVAHGGPTPWEGLPQQLHMLPPPLLCPPADSVSPLGP